MTIMGLTAMMMVTACKKDNNSNGNAAQPVAVTGVVLTSNAKLGNIITDNAGRSLYQFSIDVSGASGCTGACEMVWHPFFKDTPSIGTGLNAVDFGTITRADGTRQTTYKGWPLYYYSNDAKAGDVNGDGVGNTWFVAKSDYTIMIANAQLLGLDGMNYTSQGVIGQASSQYLTDAAGLTLYAFTPDKFNVNTFDTNVAAHDAIWPVYSSSAILSLPSILDKSQFSTITVFGNTQVTYKGHPLYYFSKDNMTRGSTKGVSVGGGSVWKVTNTATVVAPS